MLLREGLSWGDIKKEVNTITQSMDWIAKKMRVEIEFKDGFFNADTLVSKVEQFLEKLESVPEQNMLMLDANNLRKIQSKLELFVMSANDFNDEEERRFLYYLLIKHESESAIAYIRTDYSRSAVNRLKQVLFLRLLEHIEYYQVMNHKGDQSS